MGLTDILTGPVGSIIKGVGGAAAGLLGGAPTTTTGNSTTNSDQSTNTNSSGNSSFEDWLKNFLTSQTNTQGGTATTSTTNPNLSPSTQKLIDQLTLRYSNLATPSLTSYGNQQTQAINRNADLQSTAVNNIMAARGLGTSPAAATAQAGVEANRFSDINSFMAQLPILQNQQNISNLNAASNFMQAIPHGTTTTGTTANTQETNQQQTQNQDTGGQQFQNQWGFQNTAGTSNTNSTQTQKQSGSAAGGIAGLLAGLFSDKRLKADIKPIDKALDKIASLSPSSWKWKGSEVEDSGLLAQDIQKVLPELIDTTDKSGYLKVNYAGLIGTLVGAVKELKQGQEVTS